MHINAFGYRYPVLIAFYLSVWVKVLVDRSLLWLNKVCMHVHCFRVVELTSARILMLFYKEKHVQSGDCYDGMNSEGKYGDFPSGPHVHEIEMRLGSGDVRVLGRFERLHRKKKRRVWRQGSHKRTARNPPCESAPIKPWKGSSRIYSLD